MTITASLRLKADGMDDGRHIPNLPVCSSPSSTCKKWENENILTSAMAKMKILRVEDVRATGRQRTEDIRRRSKDHISWLALIMLEMKILAWNMILMLTTIFIRFSLACITSEEDTVLV